MARRSVRLCPSFLAYSFLVVVAYAAELPNILFIFSDDHAYQAVSAYGSGLNKTPNIDRLATEGVRFDRCYVTNSLCGPSRACILTGKYSHKNGFCTNSRRLRRPADDLSEAAAEGRLPDGDHRQVALDERTDGVRSLGSPAGARTLLLAAVRYGRGPRHETGLRADVITGKALDWLQDSAIKRPLHADGAAQVAASRVVAELPSMSAIATTRKFPSRRPSSTTTATAPTPPSKATMRIADDMRLAEDLKLCTSPDSDYGGF